MVNGFLCSDTFSVVFYVVDILLAVVAVGLFLWFFFKNKKSKSKDGSMNGVSKVDDETYIFEGEQSPEEQQPVEEDNAVVHFVNQISDINEEVNTELTSNAVIVNHEVEQPVKKIVAKEEIENFVVIDGKAKEKTEVSKTFNHGTNAFKNATNFVNTIKTQQDSENLSSKKVSRKK